MTLRPLPEAMTGDDRLRRLQQQGLWLWRIRQALAEFLPPEWVAQLATGGYRDGELTLLSPSGLVVAKLRQMGPTLAAELSQRGFPVTTIRWRVRPELSSLLAREAPRQTPPPRPLSPAAREALTKLLTQLPAHAPLAEVITRWLARDSQGEEPFKEKEKEVEKK